MPTQITPFTTTPSRANPTTFSADMDTRLSQENSRIVEMNLQSDENNVINTNVNTKEATVVAKEALVSPHYTAIDAVAANEANINAVATDIIPNLAEILQAGTNAQTASAAAAIAIGAVNYKGEWVAGYATTGYSIGMSVSYTDGFNYTSKIDNNLVTPTTKTNTDEWNWIEAIDPSTVYTKGEVDTLIDGAGMSAVEVSSATSITLTVASANIQAVTMTNVGLSVTLPDATTLEAGHTFIIKNTGTNDLFIKDGSGAVKLRIQAEEIVIAYCTNTTSIAGVWAFGDQSIGTDIALFFSTLFAETAVTVNAVTSYYTSVTALSATQALVTYRGTSTYLQACTLNISGTTITAGAILSVNAVASQYTSVTRLSDTQAIVAYQATSGYLYSCTLNISGTTVAAGAVLAVNAVATSTRISIDALSATQAIVTYAGASSYPQSCVLSVSGTTVTAGAVLTIESVVCTNTSVAVLSATQAIITWRGDPSNYLKTCTLNISGTTVTAGTILTVTTAFGSSIPSVCKLTSTQALVAFNNVSTSKIQICTLNISGTTVTAGTILNTDLTTGSFNVPTQVSATQALIAYAASAGFLKAVMATVSGTTVTMGTPLDVNAVATSDGFIDIVTGNLAITTYSGTSTYLQAQLIGIVS